MLNSDQYPAVDYNLSFTPALIIAHRPLSSFAGPYHRSRTRVDNPQLATRRTLLIALQFNHAPPQPAHHSPLSVYPPLHSSSSLVGLLPCSFSSLPRINTNIHPSKQTPSCIHDIHCTFTHSPTHLSLFTATLLLCGDNQPNPGPTHPAKLFIYTLNTRSMLIPEHVTALNDLTDNHKPDIIALTDTWIRSSTTSAEIIDSTPSCYSLFSASRSHTSNPSKPILAGGTAFLIKEPFIQNSAAHHYSSFEYSSITVKFSKAQLTLFNVYRPPPPSPYSQPFSTFHNQFSSFLFHAATTPHEFFITGDFNIHVDDLGEDRKSTRLNSSHRL